MRVMESGSHELRRLESPSALASSEPKLGARPRLAWLGRLQLAAIVADVDSAPNVLHVIKHVTK